MTFGIRSGALSGGAGRQGDGGDGGDGAARGGAGCARDAQEAFREYARIFRAGCIDAGPGGLPPPAELRRLAGQVPPGFGFTVMLSDDALVHRFPYGHPDRARRGELNPGFLCPGPLQERLHAGLGGLGGALEAVVLRLQPVYRTEELRAPEFVGRLDRFLGGLPRAYRYAVDLGTPAFNVPEYRACLRDHGAAHVLHHAPSSAPPDPYPPHEPPVPPLLDQLLVPEILSAPFCVACVCAGAEGAGGAADDAMDEALTLGIRELVRACGEVAAALTIFVESDRVCGGAGSGEHHLLARLLHSLDGELARRSPIRRRAA